jgi:DNA-binding MltR family transcriptional regulator
MPQAPSSHAPLDDWAGFYSEFQDETARAAVVIAAAFLDGWLRRVISSFMIDDVPAVNRLLGTEEDPDRPLSSFSARARAAYCLGLIPRDIFQDLALIAKIQNRFTHGQHGLTFDDDKIIGWCSSLQVPRKITSEIADFPNDHRSRFLLAVTLISNQLALNELGMAPQKRASPPPLEISEVIKATAKAPPPEDQSDA